MTAWRYPGWVLSIVAGVIMGCVNPHAYQQQLPPEEHGRYRAYSRVMTPKQSRTYLDLPTAAARAAYAEELGAAELLETLPPNEREAVVQGLVFRGMSEPALRLLWGMPCWQDGPPGDEHWYYYGSTWSLTEVGRHCTPGDRIMEVSIEHGTVHWWKERVPSKGLGYRRRP